MIEEMKTTKNDEANELDAHRDDLENDNLKKDQNKKEMENERQKERKSEEREKSNESYNKNAHRERRHKDKDRGKDRDKDNDRETREDKSRERERNDSRSRSRSRNRNRSRSRSRSYSSDYHSRKRDRDRSKERSRRKNRSRSPENTRRKDRRSRSYSSPRRRDTRSKRRSRSRSRSRIRSRSRSRSRSYSPRRRHASPSLSPISRRNKRRMENMKEQANKASSRFWDGFQWVDRPATSSTTQTDGQGNSSTVSTPPISLAQHKERRIYLGNLPPEISSDYLKEFFNSAMAACGAVPAGMESAVLSVWMGPDKKFAFIEMCTADSALVALGLNGINCLGYSLRVSRPKTYNSESLSGLIG